MPAAVAALGRLGRRRRPGGRSSGSATWRRAVRWRRGFRAGPGLGVRRTTLHAALADRAEQVGRRPGARDACGRSSRTATGSRPRGSGPAGWSPPTACTHRYAGRSACRSRRPRGGRPATACAGTSRSRPGRDSSRSTGREHAEAYVTPVGDGLVGVAVLAAGAGRRTTRHWPASRPCWPGCAGPSRPPRCAGPVRCGSRPRSPSSGRVLLVGDAAGYVDALTGEGVAVGLATAAARGGSGRCRAPAGLPVGLAAGDPALPVVGDRSAGRDGPPGPAPRPGPAGLGRPRRLRTGHRPGDLTRDDGSVGNY